MRVVNDLQRAVVLAALALSAYALSEPRVSLIRPPGIVSEDAEVVLQVRVVPHADNRLLRVMLEEPGDPPVAVRTTDEPLAGEQAPRTRWIRWLLPACEGNCLFVAQLWGVNGPVATAREPVTVLER